jgi:uncharacterized protein (TIGR00369 family)
MADDFSEYALGAMFGERRQSLVSHIPHTSSLGAIVEEAGPGFSLLRVPVQPHFIGDPRSGVVFGGVITTLLDQVGGSAVGCSMKELRTVATIDLRIDYMKPATPGRDLMAWAECFRMTRNVAFVRGSAYHDDREDPFATFISTYMVGARPVPPAVLERMKDMK